MSEVEFRAPLSVEIQLTVDDLTEFQSHHYRHSQVFQRQWKLLGYLLAAPVALLLLILILHRLGGVPVEEDVGLIGSTIVLVAIGFWLRSNRHRKVVQFGRKFLGEGRNQLLFQKQRVTIDDLELRIDHAAGHSATRWYAIEKVVTTQGAVYVYMSAVSAEIIPRRAFANEAAFDEFAAAAAAFHRAAHPGRCLTCGYDLSKNTSGVCPECGAAIRSNVPSVA